RDAIERKTFEIIYQSQYGPEGGPPVGVEAFVRWRQRRSGALVRPSEFITLAEELQLIDQMDFLVLEKALGEFAEVMDEPGAPRAIAINISVKTMENAGLAEHLSTLLRSHKIPGSRVVLELTESFAVRSGAELSHAIRAVSDLGIGFMLDDFGTGYTSVRLIADLPVTAIKIDGSFAKDMGGEANERAERIVRSMVEMAHNLGIKVVASGIENAATFKRMKQLGCEIFQGHHLGAPRRQILSAALVQDEDAPVDRPVA
ncbi:MAG: EAL domain-containing protein, partial [Pseudomonadota bacterium]